jgi:hypothetical protein
MKTVMSGVALAAIIALAMPAWAQGTDAQQPNNPPNASAAMSHAKKAHATHARKVSNKNMKHGANAHPMHRTTAARGGGGTGPTDNVANQLNRAEAQRAMTGGSTPPMGNPNMGPAGNQNMGPTGNPNMAPMGAPNPQRPMQGQ